MSVMSLPFVRSNDVGGVDFWNVKSTGEWGADNAKGRHYANLFFNFGEPVLLPNLVKAVLERGQWGGVEVGFFHAIAERAINQKYRGLDKVENERASRLLDEMPSVFDDLAEMNGAV